MNGNKKLLIIVYSFVFLFLCTLTAQAGVVFQETFTIYPQDEDIKIVHDDPYFKLRIDIDTEQVFGFLGDERPYYIDNFNVVFNSKVFGGVIRGLDYEDIRRKEGVFIEREGKLKCTLKVLDYSLFRDEGEVRGFKKIRFNITVESTY